MAMLAEPRRKQKWSVDPRNSTWSKDESKFGQKMLEKMGWSKGKGLGAQEQGSTDHIKVQVKNNTLGLGASVNHEDNWIAHQDDFNQILAELNNCHGGAESDPPPSEEKKSFSLEEKSKSSKKRVHYMKFAKGKDLSCRSDTDLACIFGKREKTKKPLPQEHEAVSMETEENKSQSPPECELGNTVTSTLSVSEYFAKRMAELKKSRAIKTYPDPPEATDSPVNPSEDAAKKPKKKKRNKREDDLLPGGPGEEEAAENQENGDSPAECTEPRKKSKNRRKNKEFRSESAERVGGEADPAADSHDPDVKPKKRKNKKKKKESNEHSEDDTRETAAYLEEPKKKKKKRPCN